jgi:alkylation response protein AidB-like acyl-CoA dehydrogenase
MFVMMNSERLAVGIQGLGVGEAAYQSAAAYARERLQGRSLAGAQRPDRSADPIIVHPDVRRMLMTMRAYNEGCRALAWSARRTPQSARPPRILSVC